MSETERRLIQANAEASLSPYFLSPAEGSGSLITTVQLKGENYEEWTKHVRNALRTKRKLGFLDGSIKKPETEKEAEQWEVVNSMIVAWIMNTIEPTLRSTISMVDDASVLWEDLKLQFSVGNGARVHELKADIACCKQQGDTVTAYYGRLKKMWDELVVYKPIQSCTCGELAAKLQQDQDEDRVHGFLMGLDSQFGTVRSTIISIEPLPKLSQVYQRIIREERQLTISKNREAQPEAVGFSVQASARQRSSGAVNNGGFQRETERSQGERYETITCTYCHKTGHSVSDCYQIIGYPENWGERGRGGSRGGFRGKGRGGGMVGSSGRGRGSTNRGNSPNNTMANAAQVLQPGGMAAHATRREGEYDRTALPQLSDEQWTALLSFINTSRTNQTEKLNGKIEPVEFIIDTGASHHMTWNLDFLINVIDIVPCSIGLPDGDRALALKQGDLCLGGDMYLRGVLYAPNLKCSLISVSKLLAAIKGSSITFTADLCVLQDHTKMTMIGAGEECGGVYIWRGSFGGKANKAEASSSSRELWHRRLGHPSSRVLSYLSKSISMNKPIDNDMVCDTCFRAKQTRDVFSESNHKAEDIFDLIHCDVWGPYRTPSSSGATYFLTIVDDCSRGVWIYLMTGKSEVSRILRNFMAMIDRQFEKKVKVVRSDNGTEFMCLKSYFAEEGIIHQTSCVGTHNRMEELKGNIDTF